MSKHFIGLILDEENPEDALMLALCQAYEARRSALHPASISSDKVFTVVCRVCGRVFSSQSRRGARNAIATHMRQIHPES